MNSTQGPVGVSLTVHVRAGAQYQERFSGWSARWCAAVVRAPGVVSVEVAPPLLRQSEWVLIQQFLAEEHLKAWRESAECAQLLREMGAWSAADAGTGPQTRDAQLPGGVTEVILEQVRADMDDAYRQWLEKVQRIQAGFPGYRGVSLQPPIPNVQPRWTTLLRFDTPEHLDAWLRSPARRELLDEAAPWTESLQSHRLVAPFAGWFPRLAPSGAPARWKQTMIVLLVLYPIVMLEVRFLNPFLVGLPAAVATFIGNAISVALVAWPMVPMALRCLDWWVLPRSPARRVTAAAGATVVSAGYALLVIFFWLWL